MYDQFRIALITQTRLVNLRWISVLAMAAAALMSPGIVGSSALVPKLFALAGLMAALNGCFLIGATLYRRRAEASGLLSPFLQLCLDLVAWGVFIYFTGGTTNPLISVLLPLVAIGAIVLRQAQAWLLAALAILTYSLLSQEYEPLNMTDVDLATHLHLAGMWFVFVVSAIVLTWFILHLTQALRERDAALAEAREQAIRNDWLVSVGSLAAEAAHELSTPLATMNVLLDELIADENTPADMRADLELMLRQIEACKLALQQVTRRATEREGSHDQMAASAWLKGTLNGWLALNPQANVACRISHDLFKKGLSYDISIERAIANLLDNALKSGAPNIALNASLAGNELTIDVTDDGPGVSQEAARAFASGLPITSDTGMGIGLLLSRAAVERNGGSLTIERIQPRGTTAIMRLPAMQLSEGPREA